VKLPSLNFDQIDIFLEKLSEITSMGDFINPANSAIFFQTTHSSSILRQLTLDSQARIIWGNEQTVKTLKQFHTSLLHVDLIFPSRFSVSILSADEFVVLSHDKRIEIARNFVKDALTFGQRGCSSPRLIFWLGKDSSYHLARSEFWKLTSKYASKYLEPSDYFARFANLATSSIKEEKVKQLSISINEELIHFEVNHVIKGDIEEVMTLGTFQEIRVKDLVEVVNQLDRKVQTVTYFGFSPDELIEAIKVSGFSGIDRIVPLGAAFDMTSVWDGKDIIRSLSRVIEVRRRS
jgi:hypothetical protein